MQILNINDVLFHMIKHLIFIIAKSIIRTLIISSNIFSKSKSNGNIIQALNDQKPTNEIEELEEQIKNLIIEAEQYNNQRDYVLYTKKQKQIIILEKELKEKKLILNLNKKEKETSNKNVILNKSQIKFIINYLLKKIFNNQFSIDLIYWLINMLILYKNKNKYFSLPFDDYQNYLISKYYLNKETNKIEIPLVTITFCESVAFNSFIKILRNLF